jgi:MoaA/NifB/PqqE/SkfB family radical SAM enzyme
MRHLLAIFEPKAVTLVGGGEPALYESDATRIGDFIRQMGTGEFGPPPELGLITNGTVWPPGDTSWHKHLKWIRISVDAASSVTYAQFKGADHFGRAVDNVFRCLTETTIPAVGVGFLYHPNNICEAVQLISSIAHRCAQVCPTEVQRLNMQFRPWRDPSRSVAITDRVLSKFEANKAAEELIRLTNDDPFLSTFVQRNTNIAINLLCGGARWGVKPFSECYFGLAKAVVRADGSVYPCFDKAARRDRSFRCGDAVHETALSIALRALYVAAVPARDHCSLAPEQCLFCTFNNILESHLAGSRPAVAVPPDMFF